MKVELQQFRVRTYTDISKRLIEERLIAHKSQLTLSTDEFIQGELTRWYVEAMLWGEERTKTQTVFYVKPKTWFDWQLQKYAWLRRIFGNAKLVPIEFEVKWNIKRLFPVTGKKCYYMTDHRWTEKENG